MAEVAFTQAITWGANDWRIWYHRGRARAAQGHWASAEADCSQAITKGATWQARTLRSVTRGMQGRWADAVNDDTRALQSGGDSRFEVWYHRGYAFAEQGKWSNAADDFREAIRRDDNNLDAWLQYALVCWGVDGKRGYREVCARILARYGTNAPPDVANAVAWSCARVPNAVDDLSVPLSLAERALAVAPHNSNRLGTMGAICYRLGDFEKAVERLEEAVRASDDRGDARKWLFLAMSHLRLGHDQRAGECYGVANALKENRSGGKPAAPIAKSPLPWPARLELALLRKEHEELVAGRTVERRAVPGTQQRPLKGIRPGPQAQTGNR
jgi:tetratricopeptide (TPR) repeat protein